jgi:hypothetical protein
MGSSVTTCRRSRIENLSWSIVSKNRQGKSHDQKICPASGFDEKTNPLSEKLQLGHVGHGT